LQLATISSMAVSFGLKVIESSNCPLDNLWRPVRVPVDCVESSVGGSLDGTRPQVAAGRITINIKLPMTAI
jgi:hypothetical protein